MNKKGIIGLVIAIVVIIIAVVCFAIKNNSNIAENEDTKLANNNSRVSKEHNTGKIMIQF